MRGVVIRGTADMYVGMSELERIEHNTLQVATQHLATGKKVVSWPVPRKTGIVGESRRHD